MLPGVVAVNRVGRFLFVLIREDALYLTPLIRGMARQAGGHAVFQVIPTRPNPQPTRQEVKRWIRHQEGVESVRLVRNTFHVHLWDDTFRLRRRIEDMAARVGCDVVFRSEPFSWPPHYETLRSELAELQGVESCWLDGDEFHVALWEDNADLRADIQRRVEEAGGTVSFDEAPQLPEGELEEMYHRLLELPGVESVLVEEDQFFVSLREDTPQLRQQVQQMVAEIEGAEVTFEELPEQPDPAAEQVAQQLKSRPEVQSVSFDGDGVYVLLRQGSDRPEVRAQIEQLAKQANVGVLFQTPIEAAIDATLQLPGVIGAEDVQGRLRVHADVDTAELRGEIESVLKEVAPQVRFDLVKWVPKDDQVIRPTQDWL